MRGHAGFKHGTEVKKEEEKRSQEKPREEQQQQHELPQGGWPGYQSPRSQSCSGPGATGGSASTLALLTHWVQTHRGWSCPPSQPFTNYVLLLSFLVTQTCSNAYLRLWLWGQPSAVTVLEVVALC